MPLSFSKLSTYATCPKQYEFAHVKNIPRTLSAGESFGSSMHNTLARWGRKEMQIQQKPIEEQSQLFLFQDHDSLHEQSDSLASLTLDTLLHDWHASFIIEGYATREDADAARKKGERILRCVYDWWQKEEREVVCIESGFRVLLPRHYGEDSSIEVTGRFDRIERVDGGLRVIDFKTSRVREQDAVDADLQLSIYALAVQEIYSEPCAELLLLFLREDGVTSMHTSRSHEALQSSVAEISLLYSGITQGEYAATPTKHACSRCPYRSICADAL